MALIVSTASGNFNAGATWVGGVVPGAADEAQAANGHTITITANATCTEISNAGTGTFVLNGGVTLTANVTHKTSTAGVTLLTYSSSTSSTIAGNITGNGVSALPATNNVVRNTGSGTLIVNGTNHASGAQASNSVAITNAGAGNIEVTGTCTAGTGAFCGPAVQNTGSGNVIITGNVTAANGSNSSCGAFNSSTTGTVTVFGTITAAQNNAGIQGTSTGPLILTGPFIMANNGRLAVSASFWRWASTIVSSTYFQIPTSDLLSTRNLVTDDNVTGMPSVTNVRSGTVYGPTSSLTGTLVVPVASSVASGVPVDNTIGTAVLTIANVQSALTAQGLTSARAGALDNLDATVSSRLAPSGTLATVTTLTNAPSVPTPSEIASQVRTELATELARVDQNISSRLASSAYTAPANSDITAIKSKTDNLPASPAATGDIPSANITAIKAKTDLLNTDRLAQVSTVATTGAQLAAALS